MTTSEGKSFDEATEGFRKKKFRNIFDKVGVKYEKFVPSGRTDSEIGGNLDAGLYFEQQHREELEDLIEVNGGDLTAPIIRSFNHLISNLEQTVYKNGFTKPTLVQKAVIPLIALKRGYDIIVRSETGSGKTASFLLPVIQNLYLEKRAKDAADLARKDKFTLDNAYQLMVPVNALIIAPTHELAQQLGDDALKYTHGMSLSVITTYGEMSMQYSVDLLKCALANNNCCDIFVCTMGRLMHFIRDKYIDISNLKFLILDEVDKLLELQFLEQLRELKTNLNNSLARHRTLMFSATIDHQVNKLASELLRPNFFKVSIGQGCDGLPSTINQKFIETRKYKKTETLIEIFEKISRKDLSRDENDLLWIRVPKTIVFCNQRRVTNRLALKLCLANIKAIPSNGDRSQTQRHDAKQKFENEDCDVLVATNIISRGLNLAGVNLVINYDMPDDLNVYIHRVGRTGRVGNTGQVISLVDGDNICDRRISNTLVEYLKRAKKQIPEFLINIAEEHASDLKTNLPNND